MPASLGHTPLLRLSCTANSLPCLCPRACGVIYHSPLLPGSSAGKPAKPRRITGPLQNGICLQARPALLQRPRGCRDAGRGRGGALGTCCGGTQTVDYTTLAAARAELRKEWLPARVEKVVQADKHTVVLGLRTLDRSGWLHLCWHPLSARICLGSAPPAAPSADTFSFGEQLRQTIKGLALLEVVLPEPWERVAQLRLGVRPGDAPVKDLFIEVMGRYSNVILASNTGEVIACAYQVGSKMTRMRLVQTGSQYTLPPAADGLDPTFAAELEPWKDVLLKTGQKQVVKGLVRAFRGVGPSLARELVAMGKLPLDAGVAELEEEQWRALFGSWQQWLAQLESADFTPGLWTGTGAYTVLGGDSTYALQQGKGQAQGVHAMLDDYYSQLHNAEAFQQLHQQLSSRVNAVVKKLEGKGAVFKDQIAQSEGWEVLSQRGNLLMAYLHQCPPGADRVLLPDFATGDPVEIELDPRKPALATAQKLYKRSQKLRRAAGAVLPLLAAVEDELAYLRQVALSLDQIGSYTSAADLTALEEVRDELIEAGYVKPLPTGGPQPKQNKKRKKAPDPARQLAANLLRLTSPSGYEVVVGRNNRQNELVTHSLANDYDLWFHAKGVAGSHVLLRVPPGQSASDPDIQLAADTAAYYSQSRGSGSVAVSFTSPKNVRRPKGAQLGMVVIDKEKVLYGKAAEAPGSSKELAGRRT